MNRAIASLIKLLVFDRASIRFALGVWLGLSFSIAVILSTIGIMDGFDHTMRSSLRNSHGDMYIYGRNGFFVFTEKDISFLKKMGAKAISGYVQSEAFAIHNEVSKGVAIRGVEEKSFNGLTGLNLKLSDKGIVIGSELAKQLGLKEGDKIIIALAKGNKHASGLPLLKRFEVSGIVHHGIYEKDLRFIYMKREMIARLLKLDDRVNVVGVNVKGGDNDENISLFQTELEDQWGDSFRLIPYWHEYSYLLEAVKIQKITIALILQIIVIVSIFNVLAFITFLNARKAQDIFLFEALGMAKEHVVKAWFFLVFLLWVASCLMSLGFVFVFSKMLAELSLFELPGSVYNLSRLDIILDNGDYMLVFGGSLFWLLLIIYFSLWKIKKEPILKGLRREFS